MSGGIWMLQELQKKISRKRELEVELKELAARKQELDILVLNLEKVKEKEEKDVKKLERGGISNLFRRNKEEKLEKERAEAQAAINNYQNAVCDLEYVNEKIQNDEKELSELGHIEADYSKLLELKKRTIMDPKLKELEECCLEIQTQKDSLQQAQSLGQEILPKFKKVKKELDAAEQVANFGKYPGIQMGMIQDKVTAIGKELKGYQELLAKSEEYNMKAVYDFGNLFLSATMQNEMAYDVEAISKIRTARVGVKEAEAKLQESLQHVEKEKIVLDRKFNEAKEMLELFIINA